MFRHRKMTSADDKDRLMATIDQALDSWSTYTLHLDRFRREVRGSESLDPDAVPDDLVTMNSRVLIRNHHSGEAVCYALVYPEREAVAEGRISVLSPMGMALHGARAGETITWLSSSGPEVATVERLLYQPEAAVRSTR